MGKIHFKGILGGQSWVRGKTGAVQRVGVKNSFNKTSELH